MALVPGEVLRFCRVILPAVVESVEPVETVRALLVPPTATLMPPAVVVILPTVAPATVAVKLSAAIGLVDERRAVDPLSSLKKSAPPRAPFPNCTLGESILVTTLANLTLASAMTRLAATRPFVAPAVVIVPEALVATAVRFVPASTLAFINRDVPESSPEPKERGLPLLIVRAPPVEIKLTEPAV
jgi:hypothetical protein